MKRRRRRKGERRRAGEISLCQMVSNKTTVSSVKPRLKIKNMNTLNHTLVTRYKRTVLGDVIGIRQHYISQSM